MELNAKSKLLLLTVGAAAGFVNGFLGGGGGVAVVSLLLIVLQLPQKNAQATALLVILPLTVVSAAVYVANGCVDWVSTAWCTLGVVIGGVAGAVLLSKLKGNVAKFIFAVLLIVGGIKMLF